MPSVLWCCWLSVKKSMQLVKIEWWGAGMVSCLERGADDLHMVQLMPLPPHHLLLWQNPAWFILSGASLPRLSWQRGRWIGVFFVMRTDISICVFHLEMLLFQEFGCLPTFVPCCMPVVLTHAIARCVFVQTQLQAILAGVATTFPNSCGERQVEAYDWRQSVVVELTRILRFLLAYVAAVW